MKSGMLETVSEPFPEPTAAHESRADVLAGYIDYFRSRCIDKIVGLPPDELRRSRLPSGWTPIELLKHLTYDELRWLEWRFEGRSIANPWGTSLKGKTSTSSLPHYKPRVPAVEPSSRRTILSGQASPVRVGMPLSLPPLSACYSI
jgi:hypothetical protein